VDRTVLHRTLRAHLETFLEEAERTGRPVPAFIQKELRASLDCGIAANGFIRVHCGGCGHDRLVPFSCKGRSSCSSCAGRRMAEGAANLVDLVLPLAPVRQWTFSLPFDLRFRLGMNHRLTSRVLAVVMRAILGFRRSRARRLLRLRDGRGGAVTVIQRFGSALNLNVHFHSIVLDGVHVEDEAGRVRFQALPAPRRGELLLLVEAIARRVHALLEREGLLAEADQDQSDDEETRLARSCQAGAARGIATIGPRAGRRLRRIVGETPERARYPPASCRAEGFDLHVGRRIRGTDRERMEKLARYALRPPVATERLTELPDGRLKYVLRHAWRDGTKAVLFEPLELIERLVALVPAPLGNLVRYHGSLAPGAKLRSRIVAAGPAPRRAGSHAGCEAEESGEEASRRLSWAELMKRVFATDVLECPRCSGRMRLVATITQPEVIRAMLECIGPATAGLRPTRRASRSPARPPPLAPARPLVQPDLDFGAP
jgi:hypothetical protein